MLTQYFRSAGIVAVAGLLLRLKPLILVPLLSRAYGPAGYGLWVQVGVLVAMLTPLLVLSTDSAALRFLPGQPREHIDRGIATISWYSILVSLAATAFLALLADPVSEAMFESPANAVYVPLCGLVIASTLLLNVARNYFRAIGDAAGFAVFNLGEAVLSLGACAAVVWRGGSLFELVLYSSLADLVLAAATIARALGGALRTFDGAQLREFVRFGLPLMPAGYGMWVLNQVDRLFIAHYGSLEALGVYGVAFSIGVAVVQLVVQPIWLMFPGAAAQLHNQGRLDALRDLYFHVTRLVLFLVIPTAAAMVVLGAPVVRLLATEAFVAGAVLIPLIAIAYACLNLSAYYDVALGLAGRQVWTTINLGIAALVNIAANAVLVPALGITGAAIACVAGFGTYVALALRRSARHVALPVDWTFAGKALLAATGMTMLLHVVSPQRPADLPWAILLGALCYGALMLLLRALTRAEWSAMLRGAGVHRQPRLFRALGGVPGARGTTQ